MNTIDLSLISKCRTELMGLSTIAILFCHASGNHVMMPVFLAQIFSLGGYGVDVFLFLSGLGLWYSLSNHFCKGEDLWIWYKKRYKRLLVTYSLIAGVYYALFCIIKGLGVVDFLINVSTIGFWTTHEGQWFVDAIIPIYALSPFLYKLLNVTKNNIWIPILLTILCLVFSILPNDAPDSKLSILGNIQFVVCRVPSFIFGMWIAPFVKGGVTVKNALLYVFISTLFFILVVTAPIELSAGCFATIPIVYVFIFILKKINGSLKNAVFFMGNISLESYMFNVTLPFFVRRIPWNDFAFDINYGYYMHYLIVIVLGLFFSVAINRFVKTIIRTK